MTAAPRRGARAPPAKSGRAARRFLALVLVFLLIGAGTAVAIIATGNRGQAVHLKEVVSNNANDAVQQMKDLVNNNSR